MVYRPDTGEVIWSNESFLQLAGVREHLFEIRVGDAVPNPVSYTHLDVYKRQMIPCPGS